MITQKDIEEKTLERFSFLKKLGFRKSSIKRKGHGTDIIFLDQEIGFEIELDWYDTVVIVLLVRLENGKLPGGYYMFNGKKVRVHFLTFIEKLRGLGLEIETPNIYPKKTPYGNMEACLKLMDLESEKLAQFIEQAIKLLPNNELDPKLIFE